MIISCFANRVNVCIERQRVINHDTRTANTFRRLNVNIAEINHFKGTLTSLSSASPMMVASDLSGFNDKSFNVNHKWTDSKQSDSRERESSLFFQWNIQLSVISVLWKTDTENGNDVDDRWFSENSNRPRKDPWGTPNLHTIVLNRRPLTETNWDLSLKYELNHCCAQPDTPKLRSIRDFNVFWLIVSKVANRSNCNNSVLDFRSALDKHHSVNV